MIPVQGHSGLYRDEKSNAIINKNDTSYNEYLKMKNRLMSNQKRIDFLETELFEMKKILKKLVEDK